MDLLLCDAGRRCARVGVRESVAGSRIDSKRLQVSEERKSGAVSVGRMRKVRLDMKIYKFRFTCDDYVYEVSADLQVEAETREEADKKVMRLLYEEYPIAKTNNFIPYIPRMLLLHP